MLAGRLIRAAKDILSEYARFNVGERLPAALNLATRRAQMSDQEYINQARQLREWAQSVIDQTKIEKYPFDLLTFLKESQYSSALPERIATIVLRSFPDDKNAAILSPELNLYIQQVNNLRSELGALVTAGQKLNIDEVEIPPDAISLDVIMPRNVFHDKADEFVDALSKFVRIMSYLIELTTGSKDSPIVTYTSASAIVTGLALGYGAVCGFLTFYNLLLDVVQKQLSVLKTIKDYRAASLGGKEDSDLEARLKAIVEKALIDAVDKAIASVKREVPEDRVNEIKIAIGKDARFAIEAIASGTRIGITIESLDQLPKISEAVPEATVEQIDTIIKQQKVLERRVDEAFAALEGTSPALLTVSSVEDKRE
jgi:hypothetical protein